MTLLDTIKSLLGLGDSRASSDREEWFDESADRSKTTEPATDTEAAVKGTDESTTDEPAAAGGDAAGSTEAMVDEQAEGGAEPGEITGPETGTDVDSGETAEGDTDAEDADESAAAGGDAAGSTDSMTEEKDSDVAAEPGEAAGPANDDDDLELDHSGESADESGETDTTAPDSAAVGTDDTADETAAAGADATGSTGSITEETNESISATEDAEAAGPTGEEPTGDTADHAVNVLKGIGPSYSERLSDAGIETVADLAAADPADLAAETDISENRIERWTERAKARRQ